MGDLTDDQEKVFTLLPLIPAILSIVGSLCIIYSVTNTSDTSSMPLKRLLLGLSVCDVLCTWILPFAVSMMTSTTEDEDNEEENVFKVAMGNDRSCTILGFFTQFLFSILLYNVMISYYFLLTIRFGYKDDALATWIEPIMHFTAIGYPLLTATIGTANQFYDNVEYGPGCWISNNNTNAYLTTKKYYNYILWVFGGIPIIFILLSLFSNTLLIYSYAQSTTSKLIHERSTALSATITPIKALTPPSSPSPKTTANEESLVLSPSLCDTMSHNGMGNNSRRRLSLSRTINKIDPQERQIRLDSTQAYLYFLGFLLCYTWTITLRVLDVTLKIDDTDEDDDKLTISSIIIYIIMILQGIFLPLQGFSNLYIYLRPNYIRNRSAFPYESKYWVYKRSMFGDDNVPPSYLGSGRAKRRSSKQQQRRRSSASTSRGSSHHLSSSLAEVFSIIDNKNSSKQPSIEFSPVAGDNNTVTTRDVLSRQVHTIEFSPSPGTGGGGSPSSSRDVTSSSRNSYNAHSPTYLQPKYTRRLSNNIELPFEIPFDVNDFQTSAEGEGGESQSNVDNNTASPINTHRVSKKKSKDKKRSSKTSRRKASNDDEDKET